MFFKSIAAAAVLASGFLADGVSAVYDARFQNNTAVYWGQNGVASVASGKQYDLLTTCNNTNIDIVIISFVTKFKGKSSYPIINLSDQCGGYLKNAEDPTKDTDILSCPHIGTAITQCQALGKKILLSLGGATYTDPGWKDLAAARSSANEIWGMFGPPGSKPFKYRPFANATVDGFDLDFEHLANKPNVNGFAQQLKNLFTLDKKRTYLLTAAPQCPNPDATLDQALTTVAFDAIFIQFYNNPCQTTTWGKGKAQTSNASFNLQLWQTWATTKSFNKNIRLFVGFIAGGVGTSTGYVTRANAEKIVSDSFRFKNFAGASFWDSSILNVNSAYLPGIRDVLTGKKVVKRDIDEIESAVEERDIKSPVGGASDYVAEEFVEAKVPAEAINRFKRRRHLHHRRGF
ncbi:Endochitinase [Dactylella cylindrospora]|nr:Endochitinase [Dactylella cylindrospora]